jgi:hypothetical protein
MKPGVVSQWALVAFAIAVAACAPAWRRPTQYPSASPHVPASAGARAQTIEMLEHREITVSPGVLRVIPGGSIWVYIGFIPEGKIYKPTDPSFVLTVEQPSLHEAYLVLGGDRRIVGFYLPEEKTFLPEPDGTKPQLSIKWR